MINSKTQKSTGKFKLTLERESDMNNIGNRLLGYTIESYRRKTQLKQCYRCQRFGHIAFDCKKCGRCGGATHQKRDSTASVPNVQTVLAHTPLQTDPVQNSKKSSRCLTKDRIDK